MNAARLLLLLSISLAEPACAEHACGLVLAQSGATLTVHLPPATASTETVTVCREPTCVTATLPAVTGSTTIATVDFRSADVEGTLSAGLGGVRVLSIRWTALDLSDADPRNAYMVDVTDAAGTATGHLAGEVTYVKREPNGAGCGTQYDGTLSD